MSRKKEATAKQTTRQLIGIDEITDSGLKTSHGRLIFFAIKPTNLSVQPPEAVSNRIYALMTVLKGQAEIEMLALNSKESFEDNKRHYRQRAAKDGETLVVVTADHETGGLTLVDGDLAEGKIVCKFSTGGHSGVMVPVYAFGPGAEEFTGIFENTAIFDKIKKLLNL